MHFPREQANANVSGTSLAQYSSSTVECSYNSSVQSTNTQVPIARILRLCKESL